MRYFGSLTIASHFGSRDGEIVFCEGAHPNGGDLLVERTSEKQWRVESLALSRACGFSARRLDGAPLVVGMLLEIWRGVDERTSRSRRLEITSFAWPGVHCTMNLELSNLPELRSALRRAGRADDAYTVSTLVSMIAGESPRTGVDAIRYLVQGDTLLIRSEMMEPLKHMRSSLERAVAKRSVLNRIAGALHCGVAGSLRSA